MQMLIETLPGRISYADLENAQVEDFTCEFVGGEGVVHLDRKFIKYDEIFWGETEDNPARSKGSSKANVKQLADSRSKGIDPKAKLPAVRPCVITDIEGKTYLYRAENGCSRKKADFYNNYKLGAWFDVVDFIETETHSEEYNRRVWLHVENDPLPSERNSIDDLVTSCAEMMCCENLARNEASIKDFVYAAAPNMSTLDKIEVVRRVLKTEDVPTRTIAWRDGECREWLVEKCLDDIEVDYCFPFHYFQDRIYSVFKQYHESGDSVMNRKKQVLVQHFENKGDSEEVIKASRLSQKQKWDELESIMKSIAQYMAVNDWKLPVSKDQYFPQIKTGPDAEDQNRIVFDT